MGRSEPRILFSVHSVTPYSRTTGLPFGDLRVLAGSTAAITGELIPLTAGSNKWPWAIEDGVLSAEMAWKIKEYPNFLWELFVGKAPTQNAAQASGSVTAILNKNGTSAVAATGVASIGLKAGETADVKFAKYVLKVVSATTVDIYVLSDVDQARGDDFTIQDDVLKITETPLTIVQSAAVEIPGTGLELTGGAGTIAMVDDDTATFQSQPANTTSMSVIIGATSDVRPEFGAAMIAAKRSNGEMFELDAVRCRGVGLPLDFTENTFSEAEIPVQAFYDQDLNRVMEVRHVVPTSV